MSIKHLEMLRATDEAFGVLVYCRDSSASSTMRNRSDSNEFSFDAWVSHFISSRDSVFAFMQSRPATYSSSSFVILEMKIV